MIKAKKDNTLILGLSDENMERLKNDEPIKFNLKELGFGDIDVFIFNGRTEDEMYKMFKDKIYPYLTVLKSSRAKDN